MTPEDFRRRGHEPIDWLADYREGLAKRPVLARSRPGEIRDAIPPAPPHEPESFDAVIADLRSVIEIVAKTAQIRARDSIFLTRAAAASRVIQSNNMVV